MFKLISRFSGPKKQYGESEQVFKNPNVRAGIYPDRMVKRKEIKLTFDSGLNYSITEYAG
jgi:hypothetical protein